MREWTRKHIEELIDQYGGGAVSSYTTVQCVVPPGISLFVSYDKDEPGGTLEVWFTRSPDIDLSPGFHVVHADASLNNGKVPTRGVPWIGRDDNGKAFTLKFSDSASTGRYEVENSSADSDLWPYGAMSQSSSRSPYKEKLARATFTGAGNTDLIPGNPSQQIQVYRFTRS